MDYSPAYILAQFLIAEGHGSDPTGSGSWPVFTTSLPDGPSIEDNAIALYDTAGVKDGRVMGEAPLIHYGFQVRVRARDYTTGYAKADDIADALAAVDDEEVTIGSLTYTINNVTQTTDVVPLGQDENKRREEFTVNFLATIQEG